MSPGVNTGDVLHDALGALSLRQRAITNNIANIDTPGFKASDVKFEDRLRSAMQSAAGGFELQRRDPAHFTSAGTNGEGLSAAEVVTPGDTTLREDGNNVDIEQQMLKLSETVLNYGALARMANGRLSLLRAAISGR